MPRLDSSMIPQSQTPSAAQGRPHQQRSGTWWTVGAALWCGALAVGCTGAHAEANGSNVNHPTRLTGSTTIALDTPILDTHSAASSREVAVVELEAQLAEQLVGPEWAAQLMRAPIFGASWSDWLRDNQVVQVGATGGFFARLNASQVEQLLDEFERQQLTLDERLPGGWQPTLRAALGAERRWTLCQRKQRWLGVECTLSPPIDERLAVTNLLAELELTPLFPDGLPISVDGQLVWPIVVRVTQGPNGVAGVPIAVTTSTPTQATAEPTLAVREGSSDIAVTDERGVCRFAPRGIEAGASASVSASALLGPLAPIVELPSVNLTTRPLDPRRHLVVEVSGAAARRAIAQAQLAPTLARELGALATSRTSTLSRELESQLQTVPAALPSSRDVMGVDLRERVVAATQGSVDYVVFTWGQSEFASQMGAGRTWYEAQVGAKVVEVWSGAVVAQFEESATGAGLGDVAAEQAAFDAAARKLAVRLQAALAGR